MLLTYILAPSSSFFGETWPKRRGSKLYLRIVWTFATLRWLRHPRRPHSVPVCLSCPEKPLWPSTHISPTKWEPLRVLSSSVQHWLIGHPETEARSLGLKSSSFLWHLIAFKQVRVPCFCKRTSLVIDCPGVSPALKNGGGVAEVSICRVVSHWKVEGVTVCTTEIQAFVYDSNTCEVFYRKECRQA